MSFTIDVQDRDSITTLRLVGELDMATAPGLQAKITELIEEGRRHLLVDLYQLAFCDSAGMNAFVQGDKQLATRGGWLRLTRAQGPVARTMELSGVDEILGYRRPHPA